MAAIYLIRHGQASFGQQDYDQLSDKGMQQSALLGAAWPTYIKPDKIYLGTLKRHQQTYQEFISKIDFCIPSQQITALNEFDHQDIIKQSEQAKPLSAKQNIAIANNDENGRRFVQAIEQWTSTPQSNLYHESWSDFKKRAVSSLTQMMSERLPHEQHILAFTSGGIIAAITQHVLQLDDSQCLQLLSRLRNTSITKVLFSGDRLGIDSINNFQHLEQAGKDWPTFR